MKAAVDTGFMETGIFVARVSIVTVQSNISCRLVWSMRELGTRKMKAQPFLGPAVKEESEVLFKNLQQNV